MAALEAVLEAGQLRDDQLHIAFLEAEAPQREVLRERVIAAIAFALGEELQPALPAIDAAILRVVLLVLDGIEMSIDPGNLIGRALILEAVLEECGFLGGTGEARHAVLALVRI